MDPKLKIVLVAVGGALAGMLLLGTAFAIPAALHFFAGGPVVTNGQAYGPGALDRGGMMGERGWQNDGTAPNYQGGPGMMGPRGYAPGAGQQYDPQNCPNYQNGTCPRTDTTTDTSL